LHIGEEYCVSPLRSLTHESNGWNAEMLRYFILLRNNFQTHKRFNGKEHTMETDLFHQRSPALTYLLVLGEVFNLKNKKL